MADTTALKNRIRAAIKANDNQEITGPVLQQALLDMVDELNGATETEASQRQSGDSTLQQGINTERQARIDADNALGQRITEEIQQEAERAEEAFDDLDMIDAAGSQVSPEAIGLTLRKNDRSDQDPEWRTLCQLLIPSATNQRAGLMSAAMRNLLYNLANQLVLQEGQYCIKSLSLDDFSIQGYINNQGKPVTPSNFGYTDFIPVTAGTIIYTYLQQASIAFLAFYSSNSEDSLVSVVHANTGQIERYVVPSTALYFRASTKTAEGGLNAFVYYNTAGQGSLRFNFTESDIITLKNIMSKIESNLKCYTCSSSYNTYYKTVDGAADYAYPDNSLGIIRIKFLNGHVSTQQAVLKIGIGDAKPIIYNGLPAIAGNSWAPGETVSAFYDSLNEQWVFYKTDYYKYENTLIATDLYYAAKSNSLLRGNYLNASLDNIHVHRDLAWVNYNYNAGSIIYNLQYNHRVLIIDLSGVKSIDATFLNTTNLPILLIYKNDGTHHAGISKNTDTGIHTVFDEPLPSGYYAYINDFFYRDAERRVLNVIQFGYENIATSISGISNILNIKHNMLVTIELMLDDIIEQFDSNKGYIKSDGTVFTYDNTPWRYSGFLACIEGSTIKANLPNGNNIAGIAFYSSNNESDFVSFNASINAARLVEITIPENENIRFFRLSARTDYEDTDVKYLATGDNSKRLLDIEQEIQSIEQEIQDIEQEIQNIEVGDLRIRTSMTWISIGDSITWLNDHGGIGDRPDHGYQYYLQQKIQFGNFTNQGVNGAQMLDYPYNSIQTADIYTIALGVNDWTNTDAERGYTSSVPGTLTEYKNYQSGDDANTYAKALKRMILKIRSLNPAAFIILMTPRRGRRFSGHFPQYATDPNNAGYYLHEFADLLKEVADYEGLPVVDNYYRSGINDSNLSDYTYDELHPNEDGMKLMAKMLEPVMKTIVVEIPTNNQ